MLILTRKAGEEIRIGDQIVVRVVSARSNTVQVGIEAPREVKVLRMELAPHPAHAERELELASRSEQPV